MENSLIVSLLEDVSQLITAAKSQVAREFNHTQILLNWHIGARVQREILQSARAEYGKTVVAELAFKLQKQFGQGYDRTALNRMIKFSRLFNKDTAVNLCIVFKMAFRRFFFVTRTLTT